jgi:hypothetical protein
MPIEFCQERDYLRNVMFHLGDRWWKVCADLVTGGISLRSCDEHTNRDHPPIPGSFLLDTGVEGHGGVSVICRRYTPDELREAIPGLAKLFGMGVPQSGRLVLDGAGCPYVVGAAHDDGYGHKLLKGVLGLRAQVREIWLTTTGVWRPEEVTETRMPVVLLNESGNAVVPLVPVLLRIQKWAGALELLAANVSDRPAYGWHYRLAISPDGSTISGGWRRSEGDDA